jgi:ribosomal protein S3AE
MKAKKPIKKKFFPVEIPILRKVVELYSIDLESLEEKRIKLDLTHELKGKALEAKFLIKIQNNKATGIPIELNMPSSYMKRMTRKGTDYSEDSFITLCKDQKIRIKFTMITRKRVAKKVLNGLRKKAKEELIKWSEKKELEKIIDETISGKIQKDLAVKLKKVYPLSLCEIKSIQIVKKDYEEAKKERELKEEAVEEAKKERELKEEAVEEAKKERELKEEAKND